MGRILQFSDIHFGCEHRRAIAAALDYAHTTPAGLTLITGDVTQRGHPEEFRAAGAWIQAMPDPTFVVVGNHDVPYWDAMARLFWPWRAFETTIGHPAHDHQFLDAALMVRGVTTARGWQARLNWSKGVIDLDQTRRAAEALRQAPIGALRVLACHHPLIEMRGAPMTGEVRRGETAAHIFAEAGVDLIMTGHVHVPFRRLRDPVIARARYPAGVQPDRLGQPGHHGHGHGLDRRPVRTTTGLAVAASAGYPRR